MTNKSSKDVASQIRKKLLTITDAQSRLIEFLGLNIDESLPHLVIAAKLKDHLAAPLAFPNPTEPGNLELARIKYLKEEKDGDIEPLTNSEAEAWVTHLRLLRRAENLDRTTVEYGDVVEISIEGRFAEVSSIGDDGRVYFKGGRGAGTWPDLIEVRARRSDTSAEAEGFRLKARNYAAESKSLGIWTEAKNKEYGGAGFLGHAIVLNQVTKEIEYGTERKSSWCSGGRA